MDFFEAQARAKKRTSRLLVLFALAVTGTILAAYFAAVIGLNLSRDNQSARGRRGAPAAVSVWRPGVFIWVSTGTLLVVGLASLYKWNQYSAGGSAVAEGVGGRRVDPRSTDFRERRLLNVVEEMAIASGVPVPAVYILNDEPAINAFAAGLTTSDAVVAVTRGTLEKLNRDELQGVIGHEFSHILNGDMRLNLRIAAAVFGILVLGLTGRGILWSLRNVRVRGKGGGPIVVIAVIGLALLVIGYAGYFFGRLIQAAVSRQREFLADASAVQFTRNPQGLTGALKKIGGYSLGSTIASNKSGEIGHFFFAQAFRSGITGLWATHPPLDERIRAIDPHFDGKFFEPPETVDVGQESFAGAGLVPPLANLQTAKAKLQTAAASTAVQSIGVVTAEQIANAQGLIEATPGRLRDAARVPEEAPVLVYGLLLATDSTTRDRQRALIAERAGQAALDILDQLIPLLATLEDAQRLPLLQLATPALRNIPQSSLTAFLETLDELVHVDQHVSTFEFALQKLLIRTLELGRAPAAAVVDYYSFQAVTDEISVVLSAVAFAATTDASLAYPAFKAGASQLKLIESRLRFVDQAAADLAALDAALDKLARASGPIKQRTLMAAAHVVVADGQLLVTEAELLRAIAAALDCPMPPLMFQHVPAVPSPRTA